MNQSTTKRVPKRRRGAVAVYVAVSIITLLLFASLAVDVGWICALVAEMQNTADAGALSGALALHEDESDSAYEKHAMPLRKVANHA